VNTVNGTISARRHRLGRGVVATLGMSIAVAALAAPAGAAGADTYHYSFKGRTAEARFVSIEGCVATEAFVHAVDGRVKQVAGRPEAESSVFVGLTSYDVCTNSPLGFSLGFREDLDALQIDRLDGATLDTTVTMTRMLTGDTFVMTVQLQWTGFGDTLKARDHIMLDYPGFRVNARESGTSRPASVSGVLSDGTTDHAATPWASGLLSSINDGAVFVSNL
jgi:hypothetical protein